jgi:phage-related protein
LNGFTSDIVQRMSAVAGLAVTVTAEAEKWPYVTLDAFAQRATNARFLSGTNFLSINPIVASEQLVEWESYVQSSANSWM